MRNASAARGELPEQYREPFSESFPIRRRQHLQGQAPLLIALHGGSGCPEAVCDLDTRVNYHALGREAAKRGCVVWAPGLLMRATYGGDPRIEGADRRVLAEKAQSVGAYLEGIEVYQIIRGVAAIAAARPEADAERIGMAGLSTGGRYTLMTMAAEPLIRAGVCSAAFSDRSSMDREQRPDIRSFSVSERLTDPQMVALMRPRPLMIQNGVADSVVSVEGGRRALPEAAVFYRKLGLEERLVYKEHPRGHVFENEAIFAFFDKHLR